MNTQSLIPDSGSTAWFRRCQTRGQGYGAGVYLSEGGAPHAVDSGHAAALAAASRLRHVLDCRFQIKRKSTCAECGSSTPKVDVQSFCHFCPASPGYDTEDCMARSLNSGMDTSSHQVISWRLSCRCLTCLHSPSAPCRRAGPHICLITIQTQLPHYRPQSWRLCCPFSQAFARGSGQHGTANANRSTVCRL